MRKPKCVQEGSYVAEVKAELVEEERGWSPYLCAEDAYKLDDVRQILRAGNLNLASKHVRVYEIRPFVQQ